MKSYNVKNLNQTVMLGSFETKATVISVLGNAKSTEDKLVCSPLRT